jgi:hypothetical protein
MFAGLGQGTPPLDDSRPTADWGMEKNRARFVAKTSQTPQSRLNPAQAVT